MDKAEFIIKERKGKGRGGKIISIEGNIGISQIAGIREEILCLEIPEKKCKLEIKGAYKMDISTMQLLVSLLKSMEKKNVQVVIEADMREDQKTFIHNAGFTEFI